MHMKRTTYFIDEELESDLKAMARRQRRPVAGLVREAIAVYVAGEKRKVQRPLGFLAAGRSGQTDTADRHEELLWKDGGEKRGRRKPAGMALAPAPKGRG